MKLEEKVKLNYRSVGNNRCFSNSKAAANIRKKHYYEEFRPTCGTVKIFFVLYMLLIQYLQFAFPATDVLFNFT